MPGPDLALEFGLSAWLVQAGLDACGVAEAMPAVRAAVLEASEMDPESEPVPLLGRSERDDALAAAAYLAELIDRAAAFAQCAPEGLVDRATERLASINASHASNAVPDHDAPLAKIIPIR